MAQNTKFNFGPIALTNTLTTNILNPATTTGGTNGGATATYILINNLHIANKTAGAVTFSLWKGATGGNAPGTEMFNAVSVAANSVYDWNGPAIKFSSTDFLVGGASALTSLSISGSGEIGLAG